MALKLAYETWGEGAHPLLLVHGFTGNRTSFDHLRSSWSPHVKAIVVELPGHGQTPLPTRPGREGFLETLDALYAVLDELNVARTNLLGYSQGARFALAAVMRRPERFTRLIMESGSPGLHRRQHRTERRVKDSELALFLRQKGLTAFMDYWESLPLFAGLQRLPEEMRAALRARRLANTAEGLAGALECLGLGVQPDYWPELQRQRLPTLLLTGALDEKFTLTARRMAEELPVVYRRAFEGCTHAPHLEVPEEFAQEVLSFIRTPWYESPEFESAGADASPAPVATVDPSLPKKSQPTPMNAIAPAVQVPRPTLKTWLMAARPKTLTAALVPVMVGTALAYGLGVGRWMPALAALVGSMFIQVGTNLTNDYFDFKKGADTAERVGPQRVTQSGLIAPGTVLASALACFGLAVLTGIYLVVVGGWPIVAIGVASVLAGYSYTGGPFPLAYHGLGDVFVFVFFGLVAVPGTFYVQALTVTPAAWWAAIPVGAIGTALLVVNNLRDAATDVKAGKRTLVVRLGLRAGRAEYVALLALAFVTPLAMWSLGLSSPWVMLAWLSAPLAVPLLKLVLGQEGAPLNPALGGTARLQLVFGLLFSVGLFLR